MAERNPGKSSWRIRRRFMFAVAAFCMATVGYVLIADRTSGPADTAVTMSYLTLLGIVGSYVFGATWEDLSMAKTKARTPAPGTGASVKVEDEP